MRHERCLSTFISIVLLFAAQSAHAQSRCAGLFLRSADKESAISAKGSAIQPKSSSQAWQESVVALNKLIKPSMDEARLLKLWPPRCSRVNLCGSMVSRAEQRLICLGSCSKVLWIQFQKAQKKIFVLQFHKLISEGKISGFQKFSSMMKDGKYEIETSTSLVGDKFLYLIADEAESQTLSFERIAIYFKWAQGISGLDSGW